MEIMSAKELINRYPFGVLIVCFMVVLFSISQIIDLAKLNIHSSSMLDKFYMASYPVVMTAYKPNLNYQNFVDELSTKFPNQPDLATKFNINPDINKLPANEQGNAIRLSILESRVEYLQSELNTISKARQEPLIYQLPFYFWGFLVWMGSIVIGRILECLTDQFNDKYLSRTKA